MRALAAGAACVAIPVASAPPAGAYGITHKVVTVEAVPLRAGLAAIHVWVMGDRVANPAAGTTPTPAKVGEPFPGEYVYFTVAPTGSGVTFASAVDCPISPPGPSTSVPPTCPTPVTTGFDSTGGGFTGPAGTYDTVAKGRSHTTVTITAHSCILPNGLPSPPFPATDWCNYVASGSATVTFP